MSSYIKVGTGASTGWQRPSQWLAIPTVGANEEVFYGLHAVWNTTVNPCALLCNGTGAGYTLDWGDGTITNHSFNVRAEKNYVYSSLSADTEFRGYRQALVKVIPQAGAVITSFNLAQIVTGFNYTINMGWLELVVNFSTLTSQPVFENTGSRIINNCKSIVVKKTPTASSFIYIRGLEYFEIKEITSTSVVQLFKSQSLILGKIKLNLSHCTDLYALFYQVSLFGDLSEIILPVTPCRYQNTLNYYVVSINTLPNIDNAVANNNGSEMFSGSVNNMAIIPSINLSAVTTLTNWLSSTSLVIKINAYGAKVSHSIANQLLDATALNEYFTGLGTANAGATLTITGNPGAGTATTSIATAKGWTIIN